MARVVTMADVHKQISEVYNKQLVKNAKECTQYVAMGKTMVKEIVDKYGIPEKDAEYILSVLCDDLCRHIDKAKRSKR